MPQRPGIQTRPGNLNKHPGRVVTDLIPKRRSKAEVAAERAALARAREQEAAEADLLARKLEAIKLSLDHHRTAEMTARQSKRGQDVEISADISCPIDALVAARKAADKKPTGKGGKPAKEKTAKEKTAKEKTAKEKTAKEKTAKEKTVKTTKAAPKQKAPPKDKPTKGGASRGAKKVANKSVEDPSSGGAAAEGAQPTRRRGRKAASVIPAPEEPVIVENDDLEAGGGGGEMIVDGDAIKEVDHGDQGDVSMGGQYAIDKDDPDRFAGGDDYIEGEVEMREEDADIGLDEMKETGEEDEELVAGQEEDEENHQTQGDGELSDIGEGIQQDILAGNDSEGEEPDPHPNEDADGEDADGGEDANGKDEASGGEESNNEEGAEGTDGEPDGEEDEDVPQQSSAPAVVGLLENEEFSESDEDVAMLESQENGVGSGDHDEVDDVNEQNGGEDEEMVDADGSSQADVASLVANVQRDTRRPQVSVGKQKAFPTTQPMDEDLPVAEGVRKGNTDAAVKRKADAPITRTQPHKKTRAAEFSPDSDVAMSESSNLSRRPSEVVKPVASKGKASSTSSTVSNEAAAPTSQKDQQASQSKKAPSSSSKGSKNSGVSSTGNAATITKAPTSSATAKGPTPSATAKGPTSSAAAKGDTTSSIARSSRPTSGTTRVSTPTTAGDKSLGPSSTAKAATEVAPPNVSAQKSQRKGTANVSAARNVTTTMEGNAQAPAKRPRSSAGIRAWQTGIKNSATSLAPSSASDIGSVATSLSPNDSVSQVGRTAEAALIISEGPRGRIDTPKKLGGSIGSEVALERSSPIAARLANDKRRTMRERSRSRGEDETVESRFSNVSSHASPPASSTAVDSTCSGTGVGGSYAESDFCKTTGMDVLVVEQDISLIGRKKGRSASRSRGLATLPHGVGTHPATDWRTKFIPTAIATYFLQMSVWTFHLETMVPILQAIWNAIFPGKTYNIKKDTNDPVVYQTCQKLYDFRNTIKKAALMTWKQRLQDEECYGEEQTDMAGWFLESLRFVFENEEERKRIYRNKMLLKTLQHYYFAIDGALQINGLPDLENTNPIGALILTATAFHHILSSYSEGLWDEAVPEFSTGRCSELSKIHAKNIKSILPENWTKIMDFVKGPRGKARRRVATNPRANQLETIVDEPDSD